MIKHLRVAGIAVALMGASSVAGAQAKPAPAAAAGDLHWFVGVGPAKPMADLDSRSEIGFNVVGGAEYLLMPEWGVRGELSFQSFGGRGIGAGTSTNEFGGLASVVFHPAIQKIPGMWKPYALAGIGFYRGTASGFGISSSANGFGFGLGGGTEVLIGGFNLFGEIRYINASQDGSTTAWIPLTVGIRF